MEKKLTVCIELDRDDISLPAILADVKPSELWSKLEGRTVTIRPDDIEDKEARLALLLIAVGAAAKQMGE